MPSRNIVVIGGSSGALDAVREIVARLPADFPAALFVTLHTAPDNPGLLDQILRRAGQLSTSYARDYEPIRNGHIFLAPPDRHLLVKRHHVRITSGPRENRFRPAVDPLFRTAAFAHRQRVIGVVLSGGQDDGAVGLAAIKRHGGLAIVQDPHDAIAPGMPQAALMHVTVDYVARAAEIGAILQRLVAEPLDEVEEIMEGDLPKDVAEIGSDHIHSAPRSEPPSPFTCPDCGGTLWEVRDGEILQYQCHVGHRYSGVSLEAAQTEGLEHALWIALRALEESAELRRRMARHARGRGMEAIARDYDDHARDSETHADVVRKVLIPEAPDEHAAEGGAEVTGVNYRQKSG